MAIKNLIAIFLLVLSSCAQVERQVTAIEVASQQPPLLNLFFVNARWGFIEPCGCSMRSLGGIEREKKFIAEARKGNSASAFYFTQGPLFASTEYQAKKQNWFREKAEKVGAAVPALDYNFFQPTPIELDQLGIDWVKSFLPKTKLNAISTNLYDKKNNPLFKTFQIVEINQKKILVLALLGSEKQKKENAYKVLDPIEALKKVEALKQKNDAVILLSNLGEFERNKVLQKYPQINVVFGGDSTELGTYVQQISESTLVFTPQTWGRVITQLQINALPVERFYNEEVEGNLNQFKARWQELASKYNGWKKDPQIKNKKEITKLASEYHDRLKSISFLNNPGTNPTPFTSRFIELDESFD